MFITINLILEDANEQKTLSQVGARTGLRTYLIHQLCFPVAT